MRRFIERLRERGQLTEIRESVSPEFEAAKLARELRKPLLFHDIRGFKVAMNILQSRSLLSEALGIAENDIVKHLASLTPDGEVTLVDDSPTMEVAGAPDLEKLPVLRHYPKDRGAYITAGIVVSEFDGVMNASVHRLLVLGKNRLAGRLVEQRHTYELHRMAAEKGEKLPVAIVIGSSPAVMLASTTRVPQGREFQYASAIAGEPVEVFECSNGIRVPHAEFVLEGYIHPSERAEEGPFVDITGTYDIVRKEPVFYIERMMHRKDPIYHAILPAGGEHRVLMGVPYEPLIFKEAAKVADVRDVHLTDGSCCYFHAAVRIHKKSDDDARRVIEATFRAHRSVKHVVVVDDDIDINDADDIEYAIATRVRGDEDIHIYPNMHGSSLDPRAEKSIGTKVGIDATIDLGKPWKFERP